MKVIVKAASAYFLIVFTAGFILGVIRILGVAPLLGDSKAVFVELPVILVISWFVCVFVLKWFLVPPVFLDRALMGCLAFLLLLCAETLLGVYGLNRSFNEQLGIYLRWSAIPGFSAQVLFALFPLIQARKPKQAL